MAALRRDAVIRLVREKIADGTLEPGGAAPAARALARETGLQAVTCRRTLQDLVDDGTPGPNNIGQAIPWRGGAPRNFLRPSLGGDKDRRRRRRR